MSSSTIPDCNCRISRDFDILRRTEIFSSAPAEVIRLFAYFARHRTYKADDIILPEGAKAEYCYFVIDGEAEVLARHEGREIVIQRLNPNSFFGELALFARFTSFLTVRAATDTELLLTDRESFQKVLEKYPERRERITEKILHRLLSKFEQQTSYILDLHTKYEKDAELNVKTFVF